MRACERSWRGRPAASASACPSYSLPAWLSIPAMVGRTKPAPKRAASPRSTRVRQERRNEGTAAPASASLPSQKWTCWRSVSASLR